MYVYTFETIRNHVENRILRGVYSTEEQVWDIIEMEINDIYDKFGVDSIVCIYINFRNVYIEFFAKDRVQWNRFQIDCFNVTSPTDCYE